jgi:Uma2 family endonuclease
MAVLVTDPDLEKRLKAERQAANSDGHDEVWEGLYMMAPLPNDDHQAIQARFVAMLQEALGWESPAKVRAGVNVSDRDDDWQFNFRAPDVVVFLPENPAKNFGSHWQGGPDFLVEILSPYDHGRDKLPFYASVNVREVLVIDRNPWSLELYQLNGASAAMVLAGTTSLTQPTEVVSSVLPLRFRLIPGVSQPRIEISLTVAPPPDAPPTRQRWLI